MDMGILSQEMSSDDSYLLNQRLSYCLRVIDSRLYHQHSTVLYQSVKMQTLRQAGDVMLQDHTEMFMKCMDMYQIKDSNQEQQGLETMDAVANGIEQ